MESGEYPCYPNCVEGPPTCDCDVKRVEEELRKLRLRARVFGNTVLSLDSYGCESGPHVCLHGVAKRFLDRVGE